MNYSENFVTVRNIVESFDENGIIVTKAKEAVQRPYIVEDLVEFFAV